MPSNPSSRVTNEPFEEYPITVFYTEAGETEQKRKGFWTKEEADLFTNEIANQGGAYLLMM